MNRFRVGVLGAVLLGTIVASGQPTTDCCEDKPAKVKKRTPLMDPPPCVCPLWELYEVGGEFVYYSEYFATACNSPEVVELQGNYDLSPGCPFTPNNCPDASTLKKKSEEEYFEGLEDYLDHNDPFELPAGRDGKGRECSELQFTFFVSFQPNPNSTDMRYAKVFAFQLDRATRYNKLGCKPALIFVGAEINGPPPAGTPTPFVSCERLGSGEITEPCHIYRAVHRGSDRPIQIMLLTPKDAP